MYIVNVLRPKKKSTSFIDFLGITRMYGALELSVLLQYYIISTCEYHVCV